MVKGKEVREETGGRNWGALTRDRQEVEKQLNDVTGWGRIKDYRIPKERKVTKKIHF